MTDGAAEAITAIAAAGGAVFASAVTGVITYQVTRRQVTSAEGENEKSRSHEHSEAWIEREQSRRFDAYISVMRHVGHWCRQIDWAIRDDTATFDPPLQQPTEDTIDYTSEAMAALVTSPDVAGKIVDFNKLLVEYGTTVGTMNQVDAMKNEVDPGSIKQSSDWHVKFKEAGRAVLLSGLAIRNQMRSELHDADS